MPQAGAWRNPSLDGGRGPPENGTMASEKTSSEQRKERLARALKANIAKRKAEAKARKSATTAPETPPDEDSCPN